MGAWIEIASIRIFSALTLSHPTMGAWIEIVLILSGFLMPVSHPTMGAWIEIVQAKVNELASGKVAPHDGCVD